MLLTSLLHCKCTKLPTTRFAVGRSDGDLWPVPVMTAYSHLALRQVPVNDVMTLFAAFFEKHVLNRQYIVNANVDLLTNYTCILPRSRAVCWRIPRGQWLSCHPEPHCGQHIVAICMCHEHVEGSEIERLPSRPHACGIVYLLTSKFTGRRQHLSNAVLKCFI